MHSEEIISSGPKYPEEVTAEYWNKIAQDHLKDKLKQKLNKNIAKNLILFLGDGLSVTTLAAARVYAGGEEYQLSFEKFPYTGLTKVKIVAYI